MRQFNLAIVIGEQKSFCSLKDAEFAGLETRRVLAAANSLAPSLDADHSYLSIWQERMEQPDGVTSTADTSNQQIGQPLFALKNLRASFQADDALKIAHHHRVGMRAER